MKWNKKKRRPSQKTMRHIKANKATGAIIRKNKELANVEQIAKERGVPVSRVYAEMWGGNGKNKVRKA